MEEDTAVDGLIERRYCGLVQLGAGLAGAASWQAVVCAVSDALTTIDAPSPVRLWGQSADGFVELAREPRSVELHPIAQRELRLAAEQETTSFDGAGPLVVGLHAAGVTVGALEVTDGAESAELLAQAAPTIGASVGLLAAQGVGEVVLEAGSADAASDTAAVMSAFAVEARRLLDHDRLSAYLLTGDRQAFERFAVATSPTAPGEGVVIPFEDVGLRHVVITNEALVSEDLSNDPRISGREDRVVARAGFRGLVSVPLRREGQPIGVLNFVSRTPGYYRDEDIPIAQQIADQASAFVANLSRQQRMRTLARQDAAGRERARLSRDVYHTVAHAVPAINSLATELRDKLADVDERAAADADQIIKLADLELADARRAAIGMSPRALESHRLDELVEASVLRFRDATEIGTQVSINGDLTGLPSPVQRSTYRIFEEALSNVRLHSGASSVSLELNVDEGLLLTIEDDGVGFEAESARHEGGLGLEGMTERARELGGTLTIESVLGEGARITFEIESLREAGIATSASSAEVESTTTPTGSLRAFIAERDNLSRAGLARILERAGGIRVVGEAGGVDEVRGQLARLRPDVVLLDDQLEGDPLNLAQQIRVTAPQTSILVTSRHLADGEKGLVDAGVSGFIHKDVVASEIVDAVRAVANGARLIAGPDSEGGEGDATRLSSRERGILALIATGRTNAEIADGLFFATKTVERHVATIVRKLGARNRAHAAALAVSRQLIDVDGG